jgi:hypothetical protein
MRTQLWKRRGGTTGTFADRVPTSERARERGYVREVRPPVEAVDGVSVVADAFPP